MLSLHTRLSTLALLTCLALPAIPEHAPCCGPITPAGARLAATLDSMNVESLWLANEHGNWETGKLDPDVWPSGACYYTHPLN